MRARVRAARARPHHTDDWLITYADMITLLLCFFAIFLTVSIPRKEQAKQPEAPLTIALPLPAPPPAAPQAEQAQRSDDVVAELREKRWEPSVEEIAPPIEIATPPAPPAPPPVQVSVEPPPAPPPAILEPEKARSVAATEEHGDRITTLEMPSAAFFDSGSASLSKAGQAILLEVAAKLEAEEFKDYLITVEGHTDDSPINTPRFPSNWELSTARASAVVHFFLDQGIPAPKLRAAGYADTFPKAPNRDAIGAAIPANQAQNRRVVIKLEKIETAARPGATVTMLQ